MGQSDLQPPDGDALTRVFLSYSRRDSALVTRVAEGLGGAGFLADFDQAAHDPHNVSAGIAAEDEWWKRLQEMIAAADVMVFLVSPDSAVSAVCDEEIAYARALGKRIIAVLARPVDFAKAPPRLSALNVRIDFSEGGPGFEAALASLVSALEMNVGWHRDGRKYFSRVQEWDGGGRPKSRLLREGAVEEAERWALARPRGEPEPGELFLAWVAESRAQIRRDAAVRAFWRRVTAVFVLTTLLATVAGAWFVVNGQRNLGRSESLMLARTSEQFHNSGEYLRALHLAILASRDTFLAPATDEARAAFAKSAQALRHDVSVRQTAGPDGGGARVAVRVVSPDGTRLLTADETGRVWLWDTATGAPVGPGGEAGEAGALQDVIFSDDSRRVLTGYTGQVQVLDTATGAAAGPSIVMPGEAGSNPVLGAALSPDGRRVVTRSQDGAARLWDADTGQAAAALEAGGFAYEARFVIGGAAVMVTATDGVLLADAATGAALTAPFRPSAGEVAGAQISPDGRRLAVLLTAGGFDYWDLAAGALLPVARVAGQNMDAAFAPVSGRLLTWGNYGWVQVRDLETGAPLGAPLRHDRWPDGPVLADADGYLLTQSYVAGVQVYDLASGALRDDIDVPEAPFTQAAPVPNEGGYLTWNGRQVRFVPVDGSAGPDADLVFEPPGFIERLIVSADGRNFLTLETGAGEQTGTARLYETGPGIAVGGPMPHDDFSLDPLFTPDGQRVLTVSGDRASFWQVAGFAAEGVAAGREAGTYGAMLSPDGQRLLTWTEDGLGTLWDAAARREIGNGLLLGELGAWGAVFDAARPQLALWYGGAVQLVDMGTGAGEARLMEHETAVTDAVFALDGRRLVALEDQGTVQVWDTGTFERLGPGHPFSGAGLPAVSAGARMAVMSGAQAQLVDLETGAAAGPALTHTAPAGGAEDGEVLGARFSADGQILATWTSFEVRFWAAGTGEPAGTAIQVDPASGIWDVALAAGGAQVLVAEGLSAQVYDVASGAARGAAMVQTDRVNGAALSPDGTIAAITTDDAQLSLWNLARGVRIGNAQPFYLNEMKMQFSPDGARLLVSDPTGLHWIIETATASLVATVSQPQGSGAAVWDTASGALVTAGHDGRVRRWDVNWAMRQAAAPGDVAAVCAAKLKGAAAVRALDERATFAAPILRGREGEDVCTPPAAPWWETAAGAAFGWLFR